MASLTFLVIHVSFYVSCVKAFFCKKDIICSGHQFCCSDETKCCNLTEVYKLWWFWYVLAVVLFLVFNCVLALCRFRRTSLHPDIQVGRPMYGSVTLHLPPPHYNPLLRTNLEHLTKHSPHHRTHEPVTKMPGNTFQQ